MLFGEVEKALNDEIGGGLGIILLSLTERGFTDKYNYVLKSGAERPGYSITPIGENYIVSLKKKKVNKIIKTVITWGTFIAAIISAYGVFGPTCTKTKTESQDKLTKRREQPIPTPSHTIEPDSTMGSCIHPDVLANEKNETKFRDTAALKHNPVDKKHKTKK